MGVLLSKWSHWCDVLAVPLFGLAVWYFARIRQKTAVEWVLLAFCAAGLILDTVFSLAFFVDERSERSVVR